MRRPICDRKHYSFFDSKHSLYIKEMRGIHGGLVYGFSGGFWQEPVTMLEVQVPMAILFSQLLSENINNKPVCMFVYGH